MYLTSRSAIFGAGLRRQRRLPFTVLLIAILPALSARAQGSAAAGRRELRDRAAIAAAPLRLLDVLDSVRAGHPLVAAARARLRSARGTRTTAAALGNPIFALQVENAPLPGGAAPAMERETMTTAMIPLEPLYQRGPRLRRAAAEVRAAEADASATGQRLALDAARAFYRAALAQVEVEVARNLAAWLDTVVVYNRTRVDEGAAAEADLIRSEVERDRAQAEATVHEADLARARAELASYLGAVGGDVSLTGAGPLVVVDSAPLIVPIAFSFALPREHPDSVAPAVANAVIAALAMRPELLAARERVTAARAAVTTERAMIVREVAATLGTKQSAGSTSLVAGISVPVPLFDQNRGEVARAAAERDAARFELASIERTARAEVAGAFEAARLLTARTTSLAAAGADGNPLFLARADDARRISLGAYREGAVPLLAVLDAARAWGEARVTYYQTLFAQHESVLTLLTAEGVELTTVLSGRTEGGTR